MDINHVWGNDLTVSPTGDLALVDRIEMTKQRILRRLMTALNGYIWHPEYGAGVPQLIGSPEDVNNVTALIRSQIMLERAVARSPIPQITVTKISGGLACHIVFWDTTTNAQVILQFDYTL